MGSNPTGGFSRWQPLRESFAGLGLVGLGWTGLRSSACPSSSRKCSLSSLHKQPDRRGNRPSRGERAQWGEGSRTSFALPCLPLRSMGLRYNASFIKQLPLIFFWVSSCLCYAPPRAPPVAGQTCYAWRIASLASLAQLAEHALRKRKVVGSIPTGGFLMCIPYMSARARRCASARYG